MINSILYNAKEAIGSIKNRIGILSKRPEATTWAATFARLVGQACLLVTVLMEFSTDETTLWLTFSVVSTLQLVLDFGFSPTYVRLLSYSTNIDSTVVDGTDSKLLFNHHQLLASAQKTYRILFLSALILILTIGSWSLNGPISQMNPEDQRTAWLAWTIAAFSYGLGVYQNRFITALQGTGYLGRQRAIEAFFTIISTSVSVLVIHAGGRLLAYSVILLASTIAITVTYRWQSALLTNNIAKTSRIIGASDKHLWRTVWQSAWRSGLGVASLFGINQITLLVLVGYTQGANLSSYLLGIQAMQTLNLLSQPPFYSRIPRFAQLYATNQVKQMMQEARQVMNKSLWILVTCSISAIWIAPLLLAQLKTTTLFPSPLFWYLLSLAAFLERFGAMHLQLYTVTNHIVWHTVSLLSGTTLIILMAICVPKFGPIGYPIAMSISYLSFYSWYPAKLVYRRFQEKALQFEQRSSLYPGIVLLGAATISFLAN